MYNIMQHCFGRDHSGGPVNAFNRLIKYSKYKYSIIRQFNPAGRIDRSLVNDFIKEIKIHKPQLIHIRGLGNEGFHAALAAKITGVPHILVSIHGTHRDLKYHSNPLKKWIMVNILERLTLNFATDIVTVCEYAATRDFLKPYKSKLRGSVPNGVEIPELLSKDNIIEIKEKLGISTEKRIGVCVSRITVEKGYLTLAEALKKIDEDGSQFLLLIVGGGDDDHSIQESYFGLKNIEVKFIGHVKNVNEYLSISDFFIFPTFHENLSNSLIEAMSYQLPVVATDVGGNTEVLQKGGGVLVNPNDSDDLAEKIQFFLENMNFVESMGKIARTNIEKNYSLDRMVNSWENLYESILYKEKI
ncbi:glycosyltransferase family 4 protein [Acinetobacter towneri]|uniref:glycosyltransferase family 4 protein n=1 Tax=Acinetobacter towneri TaxID=202956 RepID=UPI00257863C8|nr:glycosyltransferase family 4 protein [Acinetobacter towneri]MDM1486843.1 glycosyltransferase family 4 protein [Acinetobacter towneri]